MCLNTLHVDSEMGWGGGQVQSAALYNYLRGRGHKVTIACRLGSRTEAWAKDAGANYASVEMKSILSPRAVLRLRSLIKKERPDIVHLHASRAHVLGSAAAKMAGVKALVTRCMDCPVKMAWPNTSAYGKWTVAVVAVSHAVKRSLISSGVNAAKIRVIYSGADVEAFANAAPDPALLASLGIDESVPVLCAVGSLNDAKGTCYLIEAASLLERESLPVNVIIAGDGKLRGELEAFARDVGVRTFFVGFYKDIPRLVASADVFVMPSLTEGLGIAAVEAMAAGKPVVASAVGGLMEVIADGETGILAPPSDSRSLADAIRVVLNDAGLAARLGANGRARARENFSLNNMAEQNEKLYFELLGRQVS